MCAFPPIALPVDLSRRAPAHLMMMPFICSFRNKNENLGTRKQMMILLLTCVGHAGTVTTSHISYGTRCSKSVTDTQL